MSNGFLQSFLGALQAAVSVLLTIVYGIVAGQFSILDLHSTRQIGTLCVTLFLPALFISKVGSELDPSNVTRYAAIAVWSLTYTSISIVGAIGLKRALRMPSWTIVAAAFNNTTALPLLLVQTLASTGILENIVTAENDSVEKAVSRAQSYFLVNALCGNVITFTIGPLLLDGPGTVTASENDPSAHSHDEPQSSERALEADETTSLLPAPVLNHTVKAAGTLRFHRDALYGQLPVPLQRGLSLLVSLINAPLIGGFLAAFIGLIPPLHRAFFNNMQDGGFLNAWLTTSIGNIGDLFAALQIVAVGVKLSACLQKMIRGEESGSMPVRSVICILFGRFVMWPAISIAVIFAVASRTNLLSDDPVLWLALMLMPAGPSAMNLTSLTDVVGSGEKEQFGLAKFLTISYAVSPLLAFAVVGALQACEALIRRS